MPAPPRPPLVLPHFTRSILARSLAAWGLTRVAATAATAAAAGMLQTAAAHPLRLNPVAALLVIAVVLGVGWVSMRRRNEDTFLLCLGYGRARQMAMFAGPAAAIELLLAVAL